MDPAYMGTVVSETITSDVDGYGSYDAWAKAGNITPISGLRPTAAPALGPSLLTSSVLGIPLWLWAAGIGVAVLRRR